ncbi:MAG: glycosyl hydrolase [Clostridia bacterium]|nr:glycosyl hydrolase [Clostridia bacterium]
MWISSTENKKWLKESDFSNEKGSELLIGEKIGKPIFGWGCCISELCVNAIESLGNETREAVFKELFSKEGCDFSFCRVPMGANDFARSWYSYNEFEGDYEMKFFSIERDRRYIIPAIRTAQKYSEELRLFASPWSPPTWMKFPKVYNYGRLVMTDENLKAYALYMRRYVEEYLKEGIKIDQIHVQNEVVADQKFPSCLFSPNELIRFIADYLIDEIGELAEIWFGTLNAPEGYDDRHNNYLNLAMQNEKIKKNIKGASYQWAGKFGVIQAREDYPELDVINSECECGDGQNTWKYSLYSYEMLHHYLKNGARACVYWNMALDSSALSTWGWQQNSLITVRDDMIVYNPEYWLIKHFSHFVKRGAVMLSTTGDFSSNSTVFENPDGSRIAVLMNPFDFKKTVTIDNRNYMLKPRSFNSITL